MLMADNYKNKNGLKKESRLEPRIKASEGGSISFKPPGSDWEYHIKLRDFSAGGLGLLVKEDSDLLKYIRVGDVFTVNYHEGAACMAVQPQTVKVCHISFPAGGLPEKHKIVGLSFFEQQNES
jgi:hypothetical protein